jgi:hypothetical protein
MNKYIKLNEKIQKEINNFPIIFAFNDKQLKEGMEKFKTNKKELLSIENCGGLIRRKDKNKYLNMIKTHDEEIKKAREDDEYIYEMFRYELANHEYIITFDETDTLECLGYDSSKQLDKRTYNLFLKAKNDYLKAMEDLE